LIPHLLPSSTKSTADLTEHEYKVLQLMVAEQTNKEIAQTLQIGERTVSHHLNQIYAKLGTKTRVGAAVQAVKLNLFDEQDSSLDHE
jgi:DNA-binding CsgD family transcriptional regulator